MYPKKKKEKSLCNIDLGNILVHVIHVVHLHRRRSKRKKKRKKEKEKTQEGRKSSSRSITLLCGSSVHTYRADRSIVALSSPLSRATLSSMQRRRRREETGPEHDGGARWPFRFQAYFITKPQFRRGFCGLDAKQEKKTRRERQRSCNERRRNARFRARG